MPTKQLFILKIIFSILISIVLSYFLSRLHFDNVNAIVLDASQIAFPIKNPFASEIVTFRMPPDPSIRERKIVSFKMIQEIQKALNETKPKMIVYFFTKNILGVGSRERKMISEYLSQFPNTYLHFPVQDLHQESLDNNPEFKDFPRRFSPTFVRDGAIDKKTRRLLITWDNGKPDEFFLSLRNKFGYSIDPDKFPGVFELMGSKQSYVKHWKSQVYGEHPGTLEKIDELNKSGSLRNKFVFFAKWDGFTGVDDTPSVFDIWDDKKLIQYEKFTPSFTHSANIITNYLFPEVTIKTAPAWANHFWLFLISLSILFVILFISPVKAIFFATAGIPFFIGTSFLILGMTTWLLNFSAVLVMTVGIHYISVPTLLIRFILKQQKATTEREKQIEIERLQSRLLTKSARSDAEIRIATQVAHDIRSPIMAVKVATQIASKDLPAEVSRLLVDASDRLQNLANDLLNRYKKGFERIEYTDAGFDLNLSIQSLAQQIRSLFPQYRIEIKSEFDSLTLGFPKFHFERAMTNLINNSIEALEASKTVDPTVRIIMSKNDQDLSIRVEDNGPGVHTEVLPRLFQEKATYGKLSGTGLGLFQVKQTIESFGGSIQYQGNSRGAVFLISIPFDRNNASIKVSGKIVWVDDSKEIFQLVKTKIDPSIETFFFSNLEDAEKKLHGESGEVTLITDIIFQGSDKTGFDLLISVKDKKNVRKIVCSSLADHRDIQAMASQANSLLISKSDLFKIQWVRE